MCPTILALLQGVLNYALFLDFYGMCPTILTLRWGVPKFEPTNASESCIVKETNNTFVAKLKKWDHEKDKQKRTMLLSSLLPYCSISELTRVALDCLSGADK